MNFITFMYAVVKLIPDLIRFYEELKKDVEDSNKQAQLEEDKKAIKDAFKSRDADKLRRVFNGETEDS